MSQSFYQLLDQNTGCQSALDKLIQLYLNHSERRIIGIGGLPGSGKSTLAGYLEDRFNKLHPNRLVSVSMDGFHYSRAELRQRPDAEAAFLRRGAPWTFNSQQFVEQLAQFKNNPDSPLYWPSFDHSLGDPIQDDISIPSETQILIVEGLYVLHKDHGFENTATLLDQAWFIDIELEQAMSQLLLRHQQAWQISAAEAQKRIDQNDKLNAQIALSSRQNAEYFLQII